MTVNNRFTQALFEQKKKTEQRNPLIAGSLGITMNGQTLVEVPDRASYVYVQVRSSTAEVIQAFNQTVSPVYGLPVFIQWEGNRYVVVERDTMRYSNWVDNSSYLPRHASTHEWTGSAGDVVFVSQQQFLPLMPMPSGSLGNGSVVINDYNLMSTGGTFSYFPAQASRNLTVWDPSSTGAVMVLISIDASNGQLRYDVGSGSVFGNWLTGTADVLPKVPAVPDMGRYVPIVAVRLVSSTNSITWDNIYDVRPMFGVIRGTTSAGGGGSAGTSSGLAVLNNGILEDYANQLNLLGAGFTLSHSGTEAQLTIVGGGGGATGALLLNTSNGPLTGPLVVYQKLPNLANQYFDYSTIVGYLSGTAAGNFSAGVEAVNFSTGFNSYGLYVDDEGGGQAMFVGGNRAIDLGPMVYFSHNIDPNSAGGRYFSPIMQIDRSGGGFPGVYYVGALMLLNERTPSTSEPATSFEIDVSNSPKTILFPMTTGTTMHPLAGDWFPNTAPYFFDTYNSIPTGAPLAIFLNQGSAKFWIDPSGMAVSRGGYNTEYGTYDIAGKPHTHVITGVAFNGPFPQPVFGFYGTKNGVPLGTGTRLNVRGQNFDFTISGTTFDLFLTGTPGGGGGVDQIGVYGFNQGLALGTGTSINFRGPVVTTTISGTVLDVFITGTGGGTPFAGVDQIGVYGLNNGVPLGTGTRFNVHGQNFDFSISGTTLDLLLTGTPVVFPQPVFGIYGQDEGLPLGTGTVMNFVGAGVTATLSGTVFNINIPGGGGGGGGTFGVFGEDEGTPLGTGTIINFRGSNVTATISGTVIDVFVTGSGGAGAGIDVYNTGTLVVAGATRLDFQYPLAAGVTGSTAYPYLRSGWEKFYDFTVTGGLSAVNQNIPVPSIYTDVELDVFWSSSGTTAPVLLLNYNSDTGTQYDYSVWNRFGSTNLTAQRSIRIGNLATLGLWQASVYRVHNVQTSSTPIFGEGSDNNGVAIFQTIGQGEYLQVGPVTALNLGLSVGTFATGTRVVAYGLR